MIKSLLSFLRGPHVEHSVTWGRGFLLIELLIGLSLSTFFMVIITHYIIEVRRAQQKALQQIESFSTARNELERDLAKKYHGVYVQ